jgi:hypothetical protein
LELAAVEVPHVVVDGGNVGLPVNELAVDDEGALYASVPGGEVHRSTDGGATWKRLLRLE